MTKFFRMAALTVALLAALSGCQSKDSSNTKEYEGKSLTVVTTYGVNDGGHEAFVSLCKEFSESTGAIINDASADSTEGWKREVISSFESGNQPDVLFFFTGNDVEELIQNDKFVSFTEIKESFPDYASNINLTVLDSMKAADGNVYAVPVKGYWERLFINTDIFEELKLSPPETFEDLFTLAPILLEAGYIPIAASLSEVPHYLFEALLFNQTGPSKHHDIPNSPDDIPESWVTALEQFNLMYSAGMFPDDAIVPTHADAFELFQSKRAAMIVDGDWSVPYVRDTEHTIIIDFPSAPEHPRKNTDLISGFSMGFYITRQAWDNPDKRDAAVAYVQFITSNKSIMRLNVSGAAMPVSVSASDKDNQSSGLKATPLRSSIDPLNEKTTAFVGAVADKFLIEARSWLFGQILPIARDEADSREVLREFIILNSQKDNK